ncbi:MAG: lysophospholipid acyltransferase family protein [Planctomycetota bacterium]
MAEGEQGMDAAAVLEAEGTERHRLRVARRAAGLGLVTVGVFTLWLIGLLPALLLRRRRAWRDRVTQLWGRLGLVTLGVRVHTHGEPPPRGSLLVSNHLSYLDILVMASRGPCTFISKAEVGDWPLLGPMARAVGILFVKREDRRALPQVARQLATELEAGHTVVLFPEGTSSRGAEVLPFRASLLAPAAEGPFPVAHATLGYRIPRDSGAASDLVCWWGDMTFVDHLLALLELPYIDADVRFGKERVQDRDRKALALRLWEAVQAQFEPVR